MENTIILPSDIWKYILSLRSGHNKLLLVKNILSYYSDQDMLNEYVYNRKKLSKLINIAVKYDVCIKLLNMDYEFNECYKYHKDGNKTFLKMDWMNSLICSIWMYKYH